MDEEETEEVTAGLAAAKDGSMDAAAAAVLQKWMVFSH